MVYEDSQRPFMLPKDDQKWDAHAVETTSYALLVYLARDGINIVQENIVRFLAVMRELDGGLISTLVRNEGVVVVVEVVVVVVVVVMEVVVVVVHSDLEYDFL